MGEGEERHGAQTVGHHHRTSCERYESSMIHALQEMAAAILVEIRRRRVAASVASAEEVPPAMNVARARY